MAYDNANEDCKQAVGTQRGKTDAMGYLWLCQGVGTEQFKTTMLAQAITGFTKGNKFTGTCYNWGKTGHTKREYHKKSKNSSQPQNSSVPQGPKQPGIYPQCKKGNHWASECRSIYHKDGTLLEGNERQGQPQAQTTTRAFVSQLVPQLGMFVNPAVPQNYQLVPPPQSYQLSN